MTSQNGLTTATTISPNFVNIQLQRKPQEVKKASFTPAIDCKSHYDDWQRPVTQRSLWLNANANAAGWMKSSSMDRRQEQESPINGDPDNETCLRRTVAVAKDRPRVINGMDSEDYGKSVTELPCYTCPEMSVVDWSCRPMKNIELAFMLECWVQAWPWLTSIGRAEPPNMIQMCVFNALQETRIGYGKSQGQG
eukprot:scaffold248413_cov39-Cyclotella_meneghiniana.AAC.2